MSDDSIPLARRLWTLFEPIHAVTYFSDASRDALAQAGFRGFWMGYFAARSAPLGAAATPLVVESTFFNFSPAMIQRALPDAWGFASTHDALDARRLGAAIALEQLVAELGEATRRALPLLESAAGAAQCSGHLLGAANQALDTVDDPVQRLWQAATTLREHRGDAHVAALVAAGVSGIESLVLATRLSAHAIDDAAFRAARGWTEVQWDRAIGSLTARGLLDDEANATDAAAMLHLSVEAATDAAALQPFRDGLTSDGTSLLVTLLRPIATAVRAELPQRNPIGLP